MKIVMLGYGNVARQLVRGFMASNTVEVVQIYNRSKIAQPPIPNCTTQLTSIMAADVYIIALPDDAIADFSATLPFRNRLVVHTSGSVSMGQLSKQNNQGVFYPLQTFSHERSVTWTTIPICVEAPNQRDLHVLKELGSCISEKIVVIDSEQRKKLHLAAVFVNNFTNHLYGISEKIISQAQLDFELLKPLLLETARKMETLTPAEAQTGPAKRNDKKTIANHVQQLHHAQKEGNLNPSASAIYELITESILTTYHGKKL